jgi:lipid-binding SYLF domain-containing protein
MPPSRTRRLVPLVALALSLAAAVAARAADPAARSEEIVQSALHTLRNFFHDPESAGFREKLPQARGVLIVPAEAKGGFILGGSSGVGVLVARMPEEGGGWRGPVFYRLSSISLGPQVGGARSEVILLLMSERSVDALLSPETKFGGEVAVAAGPIGGGSGAATTDVLSYLRSKGAFIGGAVVGSRIRPHARLNAAYYGEELSPVDLLVRGRGVPKPGAEQLKEEVERAATQ